MDRARENCLESGLKKDLMKLSVVLPIYNEASGISHFLDELDKLISSLKIPYEVICIDDGSADNSVEVLKAKRQNFAPLKLIKLSRNFGKEAAIFCGIQYAKGDRILIMDSDFQHPLELIPSMLKIAEEQKADVVNGVKSHRGNESLHKKLLSRWFYRAFFFLSGYQMQNSSDFKLISKKVRDSLMDFSEAGLFFRGLVGFAGFKQVNVPFQVADRAYGETSFSFFDLVFMSVRVISGYSSKPLLVIPMMALLFLVFSLVVVVRILHRYFECGALDGIPTLAFTILFSTSLIFAALSILALYVARIYNEVKSRPRFIIDSLLVD